MIGVPERVREGVSPFAVPVACVEHRQHKELNHRAENCKVSAQITTPLKVRSEQAYSMG